MDPNVTSDFDKEQQNLFIQFQDFFPEIELPIVLNSETHHVFTKENKALPQKLIETFILPIEEKLPDEFTEFVPCFKLPETGPLKVLVYWKAELLSYQYVMVIYNKKGEKLEHRVISGSFTDEQQTTQSIATLDQDFNIIIATGQMDRNATSFDPTTATTYKLKLLPDGTIV